MSWPKTNSFEGGFFFSPTFTFKGKSQWTDITVPTNFNICRCLIDSFYIFIIQYLSLLYISTTPYVSACSSVLVLRWEIPLSHTPSSTLTWFVATIFTCCSFLGSILATAVHSCFARLLSLHAWLSSHFLHLDLLVLTLPALDFPSLSLPW